jgi:hypothetical protein
MKLIRLALSLAVLAGVVYFSVTVPLGQKTLWGHIKAIAGSKESTELVDGVREKAEHVIRQDGGAKPQDRLTPKERELLRKLIREKLNEGGEAQKTDTPK